MAYLCYLFGVPFELILIFVPAECEESLANIDVVRPSPSAPVNRMALGIDSVRLGGWETVHPSTYIPNGTSFGCFEGVDE